MTNDSENITGGKKRRRRIEAKRDPKKDFYKTFEVTRPFFGELNHLRKKGSFFSLCRQGNQERVDSAALWNCRPGWEYCEVCQGLLDNPPPDLQELVRHYYQQPLTTTTSEIWCDRKTAAVKVVRVALAEEPYLWIREKSKDKETGDVIVEETRVRRHSLHHSIYLTPRRAVRHILKQVEKNHEYIELLTREVQRQMHQVRNLEKMQRLQMKETLRRINDAADREAGEREPENENDGFDDLMVNGS